MTEDSQLTIENFGGSQDNLNFIGRNPDKDVRIVYFSFFHKSKMVDFNSFEFRRLLCI